MSMAVVSMAIVNMAMVSMAMVSMAMVRERGHSAAMVRTVCLVYLARQLVYRHLALVVLDADALRLHSSTAM